MVKALLAMVVCFPLASEGKADSAEDMDTKAQIKIGDLPSWCDMIRRAREDVDAMMPEQRQEMLRKQGEGWARSEAQWAKDFREGKCAVD